MSLGEIMVLLIVGIVVVGPKNLPSIMRTAGQWVTRLRRMSTDLRSQSGIDDLIRHEGLEKEIAELRSLARMNVVDSFITPALGATPAAAFGQGRSPYNNAGSAVAPEVTRALEFHPLAPLREREYPLAGCDAHGAISDEVADHLEEAARRAQEPEVVPTEAPTEIVTSPAGDGAIPIEAGEHVAVEASSDAAPSVAPEPASNVAAAPVITEESAAS